MELLTDDLVFRIITAVLLVSFVVHRGYYTRKAQRSSEVVVEQPEPGWMSKTASIIALPAFLGTLVYIFIPSWLNWAGLNLSGWLRWLGVVIALAGFGLLQRAQNTLGKNWSDDPKFMEGQSLITSGPYGWVRHPIYSAFLMILGSLILITSNWLVGLLWLGMTGLDIADRINIEEALMTQQFGEEYQAYMRRSGRIFPRFRG